ncbi:hypothetical protein BDK51DRAFT_30962 [Blyttiomyces helicus]|uniref:AAA+ ATPase domain-containing protein n=1 Tax=Blyttiomyces helicus TaxID=388810 RepID=A0A4V1ISU8_9FUNG|nr:hypothetical protein BDK51DRAFT_30962 [Blyttiomyces helicus]|eukprot:RKO94807.1 hypothetical protein BDK51DRAFT_30962 [Blyttiomyces helicus]
MDEDPNTTSARIHAADWNALTASLPPPETVPFAKRACYIIVGKPGCGKTTLAAKIADALNVELIDPHTAIRRAVIDEMAPTHSQILETLTKGEPVTTEKAFELMYDTVHSEETSFKGYVFKGLPCSHSLGPENAQSYIEDMSFLERLVVERELNHAPVLVSLHLSDENLVRRRAGQWVDPHTGAIYPGAQIVYTRKQRDAEEVVSAEKPDGEEGEEEDEEDAADNKEVVEEEEEEEEEEAADNEEEVTAEEDDGFGDKQRRKKKIKSKSDDDLGLTNKTSWPIIPIEIMDRLIKRPEDAPETVARELESYARFNIALANFRTKYFDTLHTIDLDASQHPDVLFRDVMEHINSLGYSIHCKAVNPKMLAPPEGGFKGLPDHEVIKYLASLQLEDGEPKRELSMWGRYCPVTYVEEKTLGMAPSLMFAAAYRGRLYFMQNEDYLERFLTNPDRYLTQAPELSPLRLCVLGGPFSGKSTQCKLLAKIYNLQYLSLEEMLTKLEQEPNQSDLMSRNSLYAKVGSPGLWIVRKCRSGKTITAEMQLLLLKVALRAEAQTPYNGWIMDGFPRTMDQAAALIGAEIIPQYAIVLQNASTNCRNFGFPTHADINDENVRSRYQIYKANSRTGQPFHSTAAAASLHAGSPKTPDAAWSPDLEISMFPYFDNLFNGFREEFSEIVKIFEENDVSMVNVPSELQIPTVLGTIQSAIDPFLPKAGVRGAEAGGGGEGVTYVSVNIEGEKIISQKLLAELPEDLELGYTKDYCPYTLREAGILQKGNKMFTVKYKAQYYHLSTDEGRSAFCVEPHNFLPKREDMVPPPPRVLFLGPPGSGKTLCLKKLELYNIPIVDFDKYLIEFGMTQSVEMREELEYMIRENAGILSPPMVVEVVQSLFTKELSNRNKAHPLPLHLHLSMPALPKPYVTSGFLLEGFPRTKIETDVLIKNNFHFDAYVVFNVDPEVAARRLLPKRKEELQLAIDAARAGKPEIDPIVLAAQRFGKKMAQEEIEEADREDAIPPNQEIIDEMSSNIERDISRIMEVCMTFESMCPIPQIDIDANKCPRPVISDIRKKLKPYLDNRKSLFSNATALTVKQAETLLQAGVKLFSSFGITESAGKANRDEFIQNTASYIHLPTPPPAVPPSICILGRPKSGKTALAAKLALEFGIVHLTVPLIIQSILDAKEETSLHDMEAIEHAWAQATDLAIVILDKGPSERRRGLTRRDTCQAKGYVLDGYPYTYDQAIALENVGVRPHVMILLDINEEVMMERCEWDRISELKANIPRINNAEVVRLRDEGYRQNVASIRRLYESRYANWTVMKGSKSKWAIKIAVVDVVRKSIARRQKYLDLKSKGKAAPIFAIGLNLQTVAANLGKFGEFCPVAHTNRGELVKCPGRTEFAAEYQGIYYLMGNRTDLEAFLADPEKFISTKGLSPTLPVRMTAAEFKASFPKQIELKGYCPVTLAEGKPGFESIVPGENDYIVEYDGKLYVMQTEEKLQMFMRTPWNYINLKLPRKLPPRQMSIPVAGLPLIGFLEQTVATALTDALDAVGRAKPKYPYKNLEASACQYLALYLKAHNKRSKEWVQKIYVKKLEQFQARCTLIGFLNNAATAEGGSFIEPGNRAPNFDERMETFLALRSPALRHYLGFRKDGDKKEGWDGVDGRKEAPFMTTSPPNPGTGGFWFVIPTCG